MTDFTSNYKILFPFGFI